MHSQAWRRWRQRTTLKLGVLDEAMRDRLAPASRFPSDASAFERCDWRVVSEAMPFDDVDGVVLPDDQNASIRQGAALRAKLAGAQVYSESFVRALLTGRLDIERADDVFLDDVPASFIYISRQARARHRRRPAARCFRVAGDARVPAPDPPRKPGPRAARAAARRLARRRVRHAQAAHHEGSGGGRAAKTTRRPASRRWAAGCAARRFDELPQLWNVLRGDMSLIGPRPEWTVTAAALEQQIPQFAFRYLVRPGITGWAQVHQGHVTAEKAVRTKLEYDLYYAKNMSLALDLAIGAMTIRTVLTGSGANVDTSARIAASLPLSSPSGPNRPVRQVLAAVVPQVDSTIVVDNALGSAHQIDFSRSARATLT